MKLKSTLWALAFACAAVSCSDDLDDGPNNNGNDNGEKGESALVTVNINTGAVTKAGEEGDDNEVGSIDESDVKDVTIYLYNNGDEEKTDFAFKSTSTIIAKGYTSVSGTETNPETDHPITGTDEKITETNHGWQATINVTMTDKATSFAGKKYGVIAITNMGSDALPAVGSASGQINTGAKLANYLVAEYKTSNGFIMSTHTLKDRSNHESIVEFEKATSDAVPTVEVFVERLAAKVRVNGETGITDFAYTPTGATTDRVVLNNVAIINQLNSGSYLLKRVTDNGVNVTFNPKTQDIADVFSDATKDEYLGDEIFDDQTYNLPIRFVIDPWVRNRTLDNVKNLAAVTSATESGFTSKTLDFDYKYCEVATAEGSAATTDFKTIGTLWAGWEKITGNNILKLSGRTENDINYLYTRENTNSKASSLNGYSTGALFKATYYPLKWMKLQEDGRVSPVDASDDEKDDIADQKAQTFYTYNNYIFEDYNAVFGYTLVSILPTDKIAPGYMLFDAFTTTSLENMKVSDFLNSNTLKSAADPFGYLKALKIAAETVEVAQRDNTMMDTVDGVKAFEEFMAKGGGNDMNEINKLVKVYTNGVCYYPYWIRHEDNKDQHDMGVMEFNIVRNNIYEISVANIKSLGLSEVDVPNPENPDESGDAQLTVRLYVKNWVVRKNSGIIL